MQLKILLQRSFCFCLANLSMFFSLQLRTEGHLGQQFGRHIGAQESRRMIVRLLAELNPAIELGDGPRGALILGQPLAIAVGADPVDGGPEAGLLLVHVAVEDQVVALLLVA